MKRQRWLHDTVWSFTTSPTRICDCLLVTTSNGVVVANGADAADDWIVEHAEAGDIVVTADVPLAARAHKKGAHVIANNGKPFTADSIGMALAMRNLMSELREAGGLPGNNPVFTPKDRSRFLQEIESILQRAKRGV